MLEGFHTSPSRAFGKEILRVIHVPALRGNPQRSYSAPPATGPEFVGRFDEYVAGIVWQWQVNESPSLRELGQVLETLGLTWKVQAKRIEDTRVELRVGRLPHSTRGGAHDLVNIADVGFGVSQVLPVLVALLVARPGQLVYIEQPEIHLHPRAQVALAQVLADAANRGVRVVAETHSTFLLQGVQTLIAEGKLTPDKVMLHWFARGDDGCTKIDSREPDATGAYGDWPEDFADVQLDADSAYLDAVEQRQLERQSGG
jgi:predicted ATPase